VNALPVVGASVSQSTASSLGSSVLHTEVTVESNNNNFPSAINNNTFFSGRGEELLPSICFGDINARSLTYLFFPLSVESSTGGY